MHWLPLLSTASRQWTGRVRWVHPMRRVQKKPALDATAVNSIKAVDGSGQMGTSYEKSSEETCKIATSFLSCASCFVGNRSLSMTLIATSPLSLRRRPACSTHATSQVTAIKILIYGKLHRSVYRKHCSYHWKCYFFKC